jgi:HEAT repeat protein
VGDTRSTDLVAPLLGHEDPAVRIEALSTARALDAAFGEARTLDALSDVDPKVQAAALKALFEAGSAAPALFTFCERIFSGLNESNEGTARLICSRLAGYEHGEDRQRSVALLRMALGETQENSGRWLSLLKRSVAGEPSHPAVRLAACQALGRLRAKEASKALGHLAKQSTPALKRAALHALERIRKG